MSKIRTLDDLLLIPAGGGAGGDMVKIAKVTLGAVAATIDFTNIPQTFRHLQLVVFGRADAAQTNTSLLAHINGDAASNYDYQFLRGITASVAAGEVLANTSVLLGYISAATAPVGVASDFSATIFDYARATWQKALVSVNGLKTNAASGGLYVFALSDFWRSAAPITSLTLYLAGGNFVAGTTATLYGLKGAS